MIRLNKLQSSLSTPEAKEQLSKTIAICEQLVSISKRLQTPWRSQQDPRTQTQRKAGEGGSTPTARLAHRMVYDQRWRRKNALYSKRFLEKRLKTTERERLQNATSPSQTKRQLEFILNKHPGLAYLLRRTPQRFHGGRRLSVQGTASNQAQKQAAFPVVLRNLEYFLELLPGLNSRLREFHKTLKQIVYTPEGSGLSLIHI